MTAEIAVLNKSAVALATDSAGTIGAGGAETKIYNTVNKIFELSAHHPVGIMIYGTLDFMSLPLETLIKQYRDHLKNRSFPTIDDYVDDFRRYLGNVPYQETDEETNIRRLLSRRFMELNKTLDRAVIQNAAKDGRYRRSKVNGVITAQIRSALAAARKGARPPGFFVKRPPDLLAKLEPWFQKAINDHIGMPLTAGSTALLHKLAEELVFRCPLSAVRTGIVIAGFGKEEICPTLRSIEIDGIIGGRLKWSAHRGVDIGRYTTGADVLGFAQDDMVERFLGGVDPAYSRYVSSAMERIFDKLVADMRKNNATMTDKSAEALKLVFDKIRVDLSTELKNYSDRTFRRPTIDLVRFMPKPDLAKLAESMIELTSLKRRVSWDQDTVGGEVDVAVISKSEGFVWIKRKHYFPRDLNPRFFHRLSQGDEGGGP